jgi:hypothetical protein
MTARIRVLSAALLRAGLLAAVLAIVAGIFGMHVMTADHASHAAHAGDAKAPATYAASGHSHAGHAAGDAAVAHSDAGHAAAGHAAGQPAVSAAFSAAESCSSACPGAQEAGAPCIPLAKTASLAVLPPQAGTAGPVPAANTRDAAGYSFIPPSPTPCELSISRT